MIKNTMGNLEEIWRTHVEQKLKNNQKKCKVYHKQRM